MEAPPPPAAPGGKGGPPGALRLPTFGFGTYELARGPVARRAVAAALAAGYRLIDTAAMYGNEEDVGAALRASGVPREEVVVTTKLWNDDQLGEERIRAAFEKSRRALGVEVIDLYLIHWPVSRRRVESWRALEAIWREGRCRAIGVSNFTIEHLAELREGSEVRPAVNQVEFSPFLYQRELLERCRRDGLQLEGYAPLGRGRRLAHPALVEIAAAHGATSAQVMLRWAIQHGVIPIPRSSEPERIRANADLSRFTLTAAEMERLDGLDEGYRTTFDPARIP